VGVAQGIQFVVMGIHQVRVALLMAFDLASVSGIFAGVPAEIIYLLLFTSDKVLFYEFFAYLRY
jgi:hypothetical protein